MSHCITRTRVWTVHTNFGRTNGQPHPHLECRRDPGSQQAQGPLSQGPEPATHIIS